MSRELKITISIIIVIIGIIVLASEYFNSKKIAVYDYMNELYYNVSDANPEEINNDIEENNEEKDSEETSYKFDIKEEESIYIGYLSIPDINLKKGFTTKESKYNNISKNIEILSASDEKKTENTYFAEAIVDSMDFSKIYKNKH